MTPIEVEGLGMNMELTVEVDDRRRLVAPVVVDEIELSLEPLDIDISANVPVSPEWMRLSAETQGLVRNIGPVIRVRYCRPLVHGRRRRGSVSRTRVAACGSPPGRPGRPSDDDLAPLVGAALAGAVA